AAPAFEHRLPGPFDGLVVFLPPESQEPAAFHGLTGEWVLFGFGFRVLAKEVCPQLAVLLLLPFPCSARQVEVPILRFVVVVFESLVEAFASLVHCHQGITASGSRPVPL